MLGLLDELRGLNKGIRPQIFYLRQLEVPDRLSTTEDDFVVSSIDKQNVIFIVPASHETPLQYLEAPLTTFEDIELEDEETDPLRSTCVKLCATKSGYTVQDGAKRALSWLRVVPLANPQQAIALLCNYIQPTRHPLFNLLTGNKGEPSDITGKHGQIQVSDSQVKQTEALELSLLQMKDPIDVTASSPDYTPHKSMTAINQDDEAPKISDIDIRRSLEGFARDAGKAYSQSLIRSKSSEIMHPQVRPEHQAEDGDKAEDSCPFPNDASLANLMAKRQYQILQPFDHEEKLLQMLPTKTGGATVSSSNLHLKEFRDQGQENDRQLVDSGHEARGNFPGEVSSDARLHTGQTSGRAGQQPTALPSQMLLMKSSRGLNKDQRIQNEASKATKPKKSEPESAETGIALSEWDLSDDVQEPDISSEGKRRLLRPRIHKVVQQRRREDPMAKSTMTTKSRVVKSTKKTTYKQPLRQKRFRAAKAEKNYREAQDDDIQDEDRRNQNMSKATYNPVKIAIPPDKTTSLASVLDDGTEPRAEDPDSEKERSTLSAMNYGQLAQLDSVDEDPAAKPTSKKDSLSLRENPESIVIAAPLKEQNTVTKPDTSYNNMLFGEIENVRILATGSNGAVNVEGRVSDRDRDHSNNVKGSEDTDTKSTHITVLVPTDLTTVALPETPVNHFYTQNTNQEHMDLDAKQPTVVHFGRTSVGRSSLRTQASDSFASGSIIAARKSALGEIRPHNEYKKRLHRLGNMTAADGEAPPAERRHLKRCSNTNLPSIDLDDSDPGIMDESDISSKRSSAKISKFSLGRNEGAPSREVSTVDPRNVFPPQQSFETCVHTPVSKLPSMVERNVVVESSNVRGSDQRPGLHSEQFGSAKRTHPAIEAQVTLLTSPSNPILPVSENEPAIAIVPKTETAVHTRFGDQEEEQGPSGTQIALVHERRSAPTPIAIAGNSPKTPEQCPANVDESPRRLSIQEPVFTRTEIDSDIWGTTIPPVQSPLITLRTTRRLERATIFREPDTRIPRSRSTVATHSAAVINSEAPEISLPKRVKSPPMASLSPSHGISSKLAVPASPIATLKSSARRQPNAIGVVKEPAMESSTVPTITPVPSSTTLPLAASNFFSSSSSFGRSNPEDLSEALGRPITSRSPRIVHFEGEPRPTNQIFAPARCSQSHPSKYSFKNSRRSNTEFPSILSEISSNKPQTNSSHYHIDSNTSSQIKLRSALSVNHKSDRMTETQSPVSRPSALERHSPTDLAKQSKSTKAAGSPGVGDEFGSVVPRRILGRYRSESPAIKSPAQSITSDASFFTQFRQQNLTPESAGHDEKQSTRLSLSIPDDNLEDETTIVEPDSLEREMQNKNKENNSSSSNDSITFSEVDAVKPHRKRSDGLQMLNHEQKWDSFYEIFKLMAEVSGN